MRKRVFCVLLSLLLAAGTVGCAPFSAGRQETTYLDMFDTVTTVTAYGVSAGEFSAGAQRLHALLTEYHRLYDIYHTYEGLQNLCSVNAAAGGDPVAVDSRILDLLEYGRESYAATGGRVNILYGAVLQLWHTQREQAAADPAAAALPDPAALQQAAAHTDPSLLRIDRAAGTVQLTDPQARLDVGAIAKGYAAERAAEFIRGELGWSHVLLNVGGNVRAVGGKKTHTPFTIGVQNPDEDSAVAYLLTVELTDAAAVTSGDYQRYYEVAGQRYAHIIDVDTGYPATYVRAVTVLCPDSAQADVLSTALFTLPVEEGLALLEHFADAEAVFVLPDGSLRYSPGFPQPGRAAG